MKIAYKLSVRKLRQHIEQHLSLKVLTTTALSVNALRQVIRLHFSKSVSMPRHLRALEAFS
jgi:hypothetical protein